MLRLFRVPVRFPVFLKTTTVQKLIAFLSSNKQNYEEENLIVLDALVEELPRKGQ
jgi:hypothetical protein